MTTTPSRGLRSPRLLRALAAAALGLALTAPGALAAPSDRAEAEHALRQAQRLFEGRAEGDPTAIVTELVHRRSDLSRADRREADALLARPTDPDAPRDEGGPYTTSDVRQLCDESFCIHWVETTDDAPPLADGDGNAVPDYIDAMAAAFDRSHFVQNDFLGWREPLPDGNRGGDARMDVYVKDLDPIGAFGIAVPERSGRTSPAYMLVDKDHSSSNIDPLDEMRDTASHEYNHVLQFAYTTESDSWMAESGATWAGYTVFPGLASYISFMPNWAQHPQHPLAYSDDDDGTRRYGSVVWNFFLTARYGIDLPRLLYEHPDAKQNAADAYDGVIRAKGGGGFELDFVDFAASTAEWRLQTSPYPHNTRLPDVRRQRGRLGFNGPRRKLRYDHTAYRLYDVPVPAAGSGPIALDVRIPRNIAGGAALVARTGDPTGGAVTTVVAVRRKGGHAKVVLNDPGSFSRITAVTVNSDIEDDGYNRRTGNYDFVGDNKPIGTLLASPTCIRPFNAYESAARAVAKARSALRRARTASGRRRSRAKLARLRRTLAKRRTARSEACPRS